MSVEDGLPPDAMSEREWQYIQTQQSRYLRQRIDMMTGGVFLVGAVGTYLITVGLESVGLIGYVFTVLLMLMVAQNILNVQCFRGGKRARWLANRIPGFVVPEAVDRTALLVHEQRV